ncbi:MAG: family 16 glycosylhydrolase [Opitutaceae bacterium]|nr:family 16 glycosylhydrolase [Opitutaceae bacterium]
MESSVRFLRRGYLPRILRGIALAVPAFLVFSGVAKAAEPVGSGKRIPHWGQPVWSEEFNVDGPPDPVVWGYQLASRNVIGEKQYYTNRPENARVEGGSLVLELRKDYAVPPGARDWMGSYDICGGFTSAFLYSKPENRTFLHGRIEFRAKIPTVGGSFPALWSTGADKGWPNGGEIDVMEFKGNGVQPEQAMPFYITGTAHWDDETLPGKNPWDRHVDEMNFFRCPDPSAEWHIYAIEWDSRRIRYFFDDLCYGATDITPAVRSELATLPQVLRLNFAYDGAADAEIPNQQMYVDYVREFQLQPGVRVHAPPSVSTGHNWMSGVNLRAFVNQPLPLTGSVSGDGMPGVGYTYEWQALTGPGLPVFAEPSALQTTVTFPVAGTYEIRLVVHDGHYGDQVVRKVDVVDGSGNTAPLVACAGRTVMAGYPLKLNAAVVDDGLPAGNSPTITWDVWGSAPVTFSSRNVQEPTVTFAWAGSYLLVVKASDGELTSDPWALVPITVVAPGTNQAPQVATGTPLSINLGETVTLPGAVSDDGLPEFRTTQQWSQVSGPAPAAITHPDWVNSTATFNAGGMYVLRLTATDGLASTSAELTVNVSMTGNTAPTITTSEPVLLASVDGAAATATIAATDADGDPLTWSIALYPAHGTASIGSSGVAQYTPTAGYVGSDSFTVQVTDGRGGADTITLNCAITTTAPRVTLVTATPAFVPVLGDTVTLAATVVPGTSHTIDHVAFSLGGRALGNGIYNSGTGTWNLSWVASELGSRTITATAYGDNARSATGTVAVVVGTAGTYGNADAPWAAGPGTLRLEAENYDEGGEGVAYHDLDSRQGTSTMRSTGTANEVDLVSVDTGSDSPDLKVGFTAAGEWLRYTLTVPTTARYNLRLRVSNGTAAASPNAVSLRWKGAVVAGPLTVPATGGWDSFTTLDLPDVAFSAGTALLQLDCSTGGFDVNWLELTPAGVAPYAAWIAGYFPGGAAAQTDPTADPDGDGLNNLLEYGLGRAPNAAEPALAAAVWTDPGTGGTHFALTFRRALGVAVVAEISDDLANWSAAPAQLVPVGAPVVDASGLFETITYRSTATLASKPRQFLRVRVSSP